MPYERKNIIFDYNEILVIQRLTLKTQTHTNMNV